MEEGQEIGAGVLADVARYAGPLTEDTIRKAAAWLRSAEYLTKAQISDLRRHGLPDEAAAIKRKLPELEEVIAQLKAALHNARSAGSADSTQARK